MTQSEVKQESEMTGTELQEITTTKVRRWQIRRRHAQGNRGQREWKAFSMGG